VAAQSCQLPILNFPTYSQFSPHFWPSMCQILMWIVNWGYLVIKEYSLWEGIQEPNKCVREKGLSYSPSNGFEDIPRTRYPPFSLSSPGLHLLPQGRRYRLNAYALLTPISVLFRVSKRTEQKPEIGARAIIVSPEFEEQGVDPPS
jgi:hypothetical protein